MIHHRNYQQIPESIISFLYSHAAPKEDLISSFDNLITFDENSYIFVENIINQEKSNEVIEIDDSVDEQIKSEIETELSQKKSILDLSRFLKNFNLSNCQMMKYDFFKTQFQLLLNSKDNIGKQLCLASYAQSLSAMAFYILNADSTAQRRSSKNYAFRAIQCLKNYNISTKFLPNFEIPPSISIPIGREQPRTPTSVAMSTSKLYIGCENCISIVPYYSIETIAPFKIPIPIQSEPYSLVYVKNPKTLTSVCDNSIEFLLFSSPSVPATFIDPLNESNCPIKITYRGILGSKSCPFSYPVISDGKYLYSIDFGPTPRIKIFIFIDQEIFFIRSVTLQKGKSPLKQPFKDLLPSKQKEKASIATNGLFISFIFDTQQDDISICRTFLIRNGVHIRDEVIQSPAKIRSWTFDLKRPSHLLIVDAMMLLIDSKYSLPSWFVGFEDEFLDPNNMTNQTSSIIHHFSYELMNYASNFIGSKEIPSLNFDNIPDIEPLENLIYNSLGSENKLATSALLLLLPFKISNGDCDSKNMLRLLDKFVLCFDLKEFEFIQQIIAFSFLKCFDFFVNLSVEKSAVLLSKIFLADKYATLLFKYLPKAINLAKCLNALSMKVICELALDSSFLFMPDSLGILRQILSDFAYNKNPMLMVFIKAVLEHFIKDLQFLFNNTWSEQRFLTCISFQIFKELILVVESVRFDYDFSIFLLLEFFSAGIYLPKDCSSVIFKVVERSIHFAFEMFLLKIEEDKSFYKLEDPPFEEFLGKSRKIKLEKFGIDEDIVEEFQKIIDNSYVSNLDDSYIVNEANIIFNKIRSGELAKEKFFEKCKNVSAIQPQLFACISRYFKCDDEFVVKKPENSICVQFITLFTSTIYKDSSSFRSVFIYFIPQIYQIRQCFLMIPSLHIQKFIQFFKLWYFLMPEILLKCQIPFNFVDNLPTKALLYSEDTLIHISKNIQKIEVPFNENRMLRSLLLYNINNVENIDLNEIESKCLMTGNYEIVRQTMILILRLINPDNLSIIRMCLQFIGTYLNEEKIMFYFQVDRLACYQNCFLIADYLREIFKKISFDYFIDKTNGNFTYAETLGLFLVMNNSIDTLRIKCKVSAFSKEGEKYEGIVAYFDDKNIAFETEYHSIDFITDFDSYNCNFSGYFKFDPTSIKNIKFIKKLIFDFEPKLSFHNIFKFAALNEFMKIKDFSLLFDEYEIDFISKKINKSLISLNVNVNDFSQLMIFHMTPLPIFAFNHSKNELTSKPQQATVETMKYSFFNRVQQNDLKMFEISDSLISFDESSYFVSTPLHPTVETKINFVVHSNITMDPQLILTVCMLGKSRNGFFQSHPLICDSSKETILEIQPQLHSIIVQAQSYQKVNIFLQPSCEFIFITARLGPSTVVDYRVQNGIFQHQSNCVEISIPRMTEYEESIILPFQTSSLFIDSQMKADTCNIVSYFSLEILMKYPEFLFTHQYVQLALLKADYELNYNLNIDRIKESEYKSFVLNVINFIKDDQEKTAFFIDDLINEIEIKIKKYRNSAIGPYNMTSSIFNDNFNSDILKQNNKYVVCNKQIYYNPNQEQISEFSGIAYVIRSDDITDSVIEFFIRVRHLAMILINICNSNKFLLESVRRLSQIIMKEKDNFIVSLDPIMEMLNRILMDQKIDNFQIPQEKKNLKTKSKGQFCFIGVTNSEFESKGHLNFLENPIEHEKKQTVSHFSLDELEEENLNIINKSSFSDQSILQENKIMKIQDWSIFSFPKFFDDNIDNLDSSDESFFLMNKYVKSFPLTNFLDKFFYANSEEIKIPFVDAGENEKILSYVIQSNPTEDLFYLRISDENDQNSQKIQIGLNEDFGKQSTVLCDANSSLILPFSSFYIKSKEKLTVRIKKFKFDEEMFYKIIENEVFNWKPCFSYQILNSFASDEIMTEERYKYLPISVSFSYEISLFFLSILRKKPKYLENHTLEYEKQREKKKLEVLKIQNEIKRCLPGLSFIPINKYKPKNMEETVYVVSYLFFSPQELNYTIPFSYWKNICDSCSVFHLLFAKITGIDDVFEPIYLRSICINTTFNLEKLLDLLVWIGIDDEIKNPIIEYISNLNPFLSNLFVECVTGHWGINSLIQSNNKNIIFQKVDQKSFLEINGNIQVIFIGHFESKDLLIDKFKLLFLQYIVSVYS